MHYTQAYRSFDAFDAVVNKQNCSTCTTSVYWLRVVGKGSERGSYIHLEPIKLSYF